MKDSAELFICRDVGLHTPGGYMALRSVAKSMAMSEDRIRGQSLGDPAVARLDFALSTAEWNDTVTAWTQNSVLPHNTSTFPSSR